MCLSIGCSFQIQFVEMLFLNVPPKCHIYVWQMYDLIFCSLLSIKIMMHIQSVSQKMYFKSKLHTTGFPWSLTHNSESLLRQYWKVSSGIPSSHSCHLQVEHVLKKYIENSLSLWKKGKQTNNKNKKTHGTRSSEKGCSNMMIKQMGPELKKIKRIN